MWSIGRFNASEIHLLLLQNNLKFLKKNLLKPTSTFIRRLSEINYRKSLQGKCTDDDDTFA